jgi:hypothetical protein
MFQNSSHSPSVSSLLIRYLKKPQAFPFLLSVFLLLTWLSLRLQHTSNFSAPSFDNKWSKEDDAKANLVRFSSGFPSTLAKDNRGWSLNPISLALHSGISGTFFYTRTHLPRFILCYGYSIHIFGCLTYGYNFSVDFLFFVFCFMFSFAFFVFFFCFFFPF